jgi:hypothetical protein
LVEEPVDRHERTGLRRCAGRDTRRLPRWWGCAGRCVYRAATWVRLSITLAAESRELPANVGVISQLVHGCGGGGVRYLGWREGPNRALSIETAHVPHGHAIVVEGGTRE